MKFVIVNIFFYFVMPNILYGYMDPGTWSYLLSVIIAFIAGIIFYLRSVWEKIKEIFNKLIKKIS